MTISLTLGAGKTGLTLTPDLRNADGTGAVGLTTASMIEVAAGSGSYEWAGTIPDAHRGYLAFLNGGAFVTHVALNGQEVELSDVKTSTRSSHTAADVWASATRTLTSFGTLAADIATAVWAAGTRTLTSFGTLVADVSTAVWSAVSRTLTGVVAGLTAADVWAYATRTLTMTAAQIAAVLTGNTLTLQRGDTFTASLTGLGSLVGRSKLWFTVKHRYDDADTAAILQIEETGGLLRLLGAAGTAIQGTLVVTDAATGALTLTLIPAASSLLIPGKHYLYDVQMLTGTVLRTLTAGTFVVSSDVTRATS